MKDPIQLWKDARDEMSNRNYPKALKLLEKAHKLDPTNVDVISERAVVFFHLGDKEKALSELDRCVLLEPDHSYRYSSRAYIKADLKDLKGAVLDYEKCLQLDPDDAIAYNNLGLLLEALGRKEAAQRRFKQAKEKEDALETDYNQESNVKSQTELPKIGSVESKVKNYKEELAEEKNEERNDTPSKWEVVKEVFKSKSLFKEYVSFVKNGLKPQQDKDSEDE